MQNKKGQFKKGVYQGFGFKKGHKINIGEKNGMFGKIENLAHQWKGELATKDTKHRWVERWKGKPNKCEMCGTEEKRKYEWANIDHKYRRVLEDYIRLCTPCHRNYDKSRGVKIGK